MNVLRRSFLKFSASAATLSTTLGAFATAGFLNTTRAIAATWNKTGFESKAVADAMKALGATGATESRDIIITAQKIDQRLVDVPITVTATVWSAVAPN